jgi:hypothetical protein
MWKQGFLTLGIVCAAFTSSIAKADKVLLSDVDSRRMATALGRHAVSTEGTRPLIQKRIIAENLTCRQQYTTTRGVITHCGYETPAINGKKTYKIDSKIQNALLSEALREIPLYRTKIGRTNVTRISRVECDTANKKARCILTQ